MTEELNVLNVSSISEERMAEIYARAEVEDEKGLWQEFRKVLQTEKHRHPNDESTRRHVLQRAMECLKITPTEANIIFSYLERTYGP